MKNTDTPKGFTLVELMIVLALITIITSISIQAWQHYRINTNLRTASREIMADIINTKQRTISEKKPTSYSITFDKDNNSYSLSRTDTSGTVTLWTKSPASSGTGIIIQNVDFSGGSVINFQRRGTVTFGTITLKNSINSTAAVTTQITGRAYVQYNLQK